MTSAQATAGTTAPATTPIAARFVPWSLPAAFLFAAGIVTAALGLAWPWLGLASLALPLMLGLRWPRWLLLLVLLVPAGYLRYSLWEAQPNPLATSLGKTVTLSGVSDGRYLTLDTPEWARVVLSPRGVVGPGMATVKGELVLPSGKRNPGGFDYRAYLRRRGVRGQLFVDEVLAFAPAPPNIAERIRLGVVAGLSGPRAALMEAMTLGIREHLGELQQDFADSGLAHVLALSGLNFGILIAVAGFLLRPLGLLRYPAIILFVVGFVLLVDSSPSVLRAGVMAVVVLASLWLGAGRVEPWPALALAALATLTWNPSLLFDLAFQLSYLAVMGMLLCVPPAMRRLFGDRLTPPAWWHWRSLVVGGLVVTLAAQSLVLPVLADSFGSVPLFGPLVNIVAVPLATLLVPLGFLAGVLGLVWLPLAVALNTLTGLLAGLLIALADAAARLPSLRWGEIGPYGYAFYYLAALALVLALWGYLRPDRAWLVMAAALVGSTISTPGHLPPDVVVLDVGQGDAALIRLPGRHEILVDGGGTPFSDFDLGAETVVPALRALGVDELELVVATHPDADHVEGLVSVLELMPVGHLIVGSSAAGQPLFEVLLHTAERRGVEVVTVARGQQLFLGPARLDILNPPRTPYQADNDNSVAFVLRLEGKARALFLGDMSARVESNLALPDVDLLMVPHHGSRSSTSEALLRAARPETAVISYGRNGYGHPHPEVLARLASAGVTVHETYREGAVRLPLAP